VGYDVKFPTLIAVQLEPWHENSKFNKDPSLIVLGWYAYITGEKLAGSDLAGLKRDLHNRIALGLRVRDQGGPCAFRCSFESRIKEVPNSLSKKAKWRRYYLGVHDP